MTSHIDHNRPNVTGEKSCFKECPGVVIPKNICLLFVFTFILLGLVFESIGANGISVCNIVVLQHRKGFHTDQQHIYVENNDDRFNNLRYFKSLCVPETCNRQAEERDEMAAECVSVHILKLLF